MFKNLFKSQRHREIERDINMAATKINGRKRPILVDIMGFILAVLITSAKVDDGVAAVMLFEKIDPIQYPRLQIIWGDNKYHHFALEAWMKEH